MRILFTNHGWEDLSFWIEHDVNIVKKIKELINSINQNPFKGLGKPEPLKHQMKGYWSRRITQEHRLVYEITGKKGVDQTCTILQCRFHYK